MDNKKYKFRLDRSRPHHERSIDQESDRIVDFLSPSSPSPYNRSMLSWLYFKIFRPFEFNFKRILKPILGRNLYVWSNLKKVKQFIVEGQSVPLGLVESTPIRICEKLNSNGRPFGVNLAGHLRSEKGVGEAGRATARALEAALIPYVINDVFDSGSINMDQASGRFTRGNPYSVNLMHINADQVPYFAAQKGDSYFKGRYNIGCWFWELSQFPREWSSSFRFFNELWAPSSFICDNLLRISSIPVVKVPLALSPDLEVIPGVRREYFGLPVDKFIFLSIFDFASVLERKNPLGLIDAFKLAFGVKDDAMLVLKVAHSDQYPAELKVLRNACAGTNVRIIDGVLTRRALNTLMSYCDCYASLHRSEGYGLTIAEAMTLGKPVIVTAYSGNMDFTSAANSFLVKYQLAEIDRDYGPYRRGFSWADPDLSHAAELMEYVFKNGARAYDVGQQGRRDVLELFNPNVVGQQIKERLLSIISMDKMV